MPQLTVCRQSSTEHVHYNIVTFEDNLPIPPPLWINSKPMGRGFAKLRDLARRVGGRTAGQVVTIILENWSSRLGMITIKSIAREVLPLWELCHKGEEKSFSIDWDLPLYGSAPVVAGPGTTGRVVPVAHIRQ